MVDADNKDVKVDDKKDQDGDKVDRSELKKVIEQRQELKEELRAVKSQMEEFSKFKEENETLKSQISELGSLKSELEQIRKSKEEEELSKKSGSEREIILAKKEIEKLRTDLQSKLDEKLKQIEEKDKVENSLKERISKLRDTTLESQIRESAEKNGAYSPSQIVMLLKNRFEYNEKDDTYYVNVYKHSSLIDVIKVEDFVKSFLSDDENANLVKSSHKKGIDVDVKSDDSTNKDKGKKGKNKLELPADSKFTLEEVEAKLKKWAEFRKLDYDFAIGMYNLHKDKLFK